MPKETQRKPGSYAGIGTLCAALFVDTVFYGEVNGDATVSSILLLIA
jgi:hypothetical protein